MLTYLTRPFLFFPFFSSLGNTNTHGDQKRIDQKGAGPSLTETLLKQAEHRRVFRFVTSDGRKVSTEGEIVGTKRNTEEKGMKSQEEVSKIEKKEDEGVIEVLMDRVKDMDAEDRAHFERITRLFAIEDRATHCISRTLIYYIV